MTIFDLVTANNITVYYNDRGSSTASPLVGETLWRPRKQLDTNLTQIKAAKGKSVVLKASAYDVEAVPRLRGTFNKQSMEIPYWKESMYIDEVTRKELNKVLQTGNQQYINLVLNTIYNDPATLIDAARMRREMMRMQLLTTGAIMVESNGQKYDYDFGMPTAHKITASTAWSNPDADIIGDINRGLDVMDADNVIMPERAMVNRQLWMNMTKNKAIASILYPLGNVTDITEEQVRRTIAERTGITFAVNPGSYIGDDGDTHKFIPDDTASFFPSGYLGDDVFATTPQEDDLMTGSAANVSIVDTAVSVTTVKHTDPVNVETIVAMTYLPDFPTVESLMIIDAAG